jgi:hypothetical protein
MINISYTCMYESNYFSIVNCMIVLCIVFDLWGPQVRLVKTNWVYPLWIKDIIIIIIIISTKKADIIK